MMVDAFPETGIGKIKRFELKKMVQEKIKKGGSL
jgi:acyl-coenzyme A synthetase/AMP-(fatty) acid ligase